ncbi:MAG: alpha-1,4-glucan--maltose-1-phosphate maltosyltransferase [Pseudomonadota bacterium]
MPTATFLAPRIYYFFPALAITPELLTTHLVECRQMGFTHVMVAADNKIELERPDVPAAVSGAAIALHLSIDALALACKNHGLSLLMDIDFSDEVSEATYESEQDESLPDPRRAGSVGRNEGSVSFSARIPASNLAVWHSRLHALIDAGVAGFCCRSLAQRSQAFWHALVAEAKKIRTDVFFVAWTPGCSPAQVETMANCGFDATIASTAWWDYSAKWLGEEAARLAQVAPSIATVDDPLQPMLYRKQHNEDDARFRLRCTRALNLAAASGHGTLVPMGMEWGFSGMRDPRAGAMHALDAIDSDEKLDLSSEITAANALIDKLATKLPFQQRISVLTSTTKQTGVTAILRQSLLESGRTSEEALLVVINQDIKTSNIVSLDDYRGEMSGRAALNAFWPGTEAAPATVTQTLALEPGALKILVARHRPAIVSPIARGKRPVEAACRAPRIAIEAVTPAVDNGSFPVKRSVGELVDVQADVFMDGHDKLGVMLLWRPVDTVGWEEVRMTPLGNDRWQAALPLQRVGRYKYTVIAWRDAFATYRDELTKKAGAGLNVGLEIEEGRRLIESAAAHAVTAGRAVAATTLADVVALLAPATAIGGEPVDATSPRAAAALQSQIVAVLLAEDTLRAMQEADDRPFAVRYEPELILDSERTAARFASWYELFPRSQSGDVKRHGTFADVEKRLPAIRDMGFDTLYFPPIHPIGKSNRKGPNNSLTPSDTDPGSPYAIGSAAGGHDALHPELGTLEDFRHLCAAAHNHGLEIALDFAIQCSPDHPWIKDHPDWFAWRPDGSMRYAENPPKKYEDIVNVDFYAVGAMPALWIALRDVVLFWVNEGVRVFRVDNPHTKPLPFWQWMIGDVRGRFPDVIFLSEAFTRPKVMYRLAKVGFSQSYTYFTWRHTKAEFTDYLTELSTTGVKDYFRPHFFVNTPDINPVFLQKSGRPGFLIRAALATTLSGLWGMYSGFELCEATPVPGKEDYLDSEKYEIRAWDWQRPGNIIAQITALNRIRRANPALQSHLGVQFIESSDPHILCFMKSTPSKAGSTHSGNNTVFVAINLDPSAAHSTMFSLPFWQFGISDHAVLEAEDLVHGNRFTLQGTSHQLHLDITGLPYAIWRLQTPTL